MDWHWAVELNGLTLPGAAFRETYYTPTFSKHSGTMCAVVWLYVTDREEFNAIRMAIAMLVTAKRLYSAFEWRYDSWDDEHPYWIDKLTGSSYVRKAVNAGKDTDQVVAGWQDELAAFRKKRKQYLLYH